MNSSNDNRFDEQLDRMLTSSVKPGAEPQSLMIQRIPSKPRFKRALVGGLAACIVLPVILMAVWVTAHLSTGPDAAAIPGSDLSTVLTDAINSAAANLSSSTFLMYAAIAVAGVYVFAANRIVQLYRHH